MTTNYHTAIATGAAANASVFNLPLGQLDASLDDAMSFGINNNAELVAARSPYVSLAARLAAITGGYIGGNIATLTNGTAAAAQKDITVDSTVGFLVGAYVAYTLVGGTVEYNVIASITPTTVLTMTTNIGTGGIGDNVYVGMISVSEYQAANAIPHGATPLTLPQAMAYANGNVINVDAYGPDGVDDTVALQAAFDAATTRSKIVFGAGKTYYISDTISCTQRQFITIDGAQAVIKIKSGTDMSGKAMLDLTATGHCVMRDLYIEGTATGTDTAAAGVVVGRASAVLTGGFNCFEHCTIYGSFDVACLYNCCEEVDVFINCRFFNNQSAGVGIPACCLYDSSLDAYSLVPYDDTSNVRKSYFNCTFWSFGTASPCVQLNGYCSENVFRDCYFRVMPGGIVIETLGVTAQQYRMIIENCRVEGEDVTGYSASRLLRISNSGGVYGLKIENLLWPFTDSEAIIEVGTALASAVIDLRGPQGDPLGILVKAGKIFYNSQVFYDLAPCIEVEAGATVYGNVITGYDSAALANPFTGAGSYEGMNANSNVVFNGTYYAQLPAIRTFNSIPSASNDTTPSIKGYSIIELQNTAPTSVTTFDDAVAGQELNVYFSNGNTTLVHGTPLRLAGSTNKNFAAGDNITLYYSAVQSAWVEKSRMIA